MLAANSSPQSVNHGNNLNLGATIDTVGSGISFSAPHTINLDPGSYVVSFNGLSNSTCAGNIGVTMKVGGSPVATATQYYGNGNGSGAVMVNHNLTVMSPTAITFSNESGDSLSYPSLSVSVIKVG